MGLLMEYFDEDKDDPQASSDEVSDETQTEASQNDQDRTPEDAARLYPDSSAPDGRPPILYDPLTGETMRNNTINIRTVDLDSVRPPVPIPRAPYPDETWLESINRIVRFFAPDQTITADVQELPGEPRPNEPWIQTFRRVDAWNLRRLTYGNVNSNRSQRIGSNPAMTSVARITGSSRPRRGVSPVPSRRPHPARQLYAFTGRDEADGEPLSLPPGLGPDYPDDPAVRALNRLRNLPPRYDSTDDADEVRRDRRALAEALREARERVERSNAALRARLYDTMPPRNTYQPYAEDEEEDAPEGFGPNYYRD